MSDEPAQPLYRKHPLAKLAIGIGGILIGLLDTDFSTNIRLFFGLMGAVHLEELSVRYLGLQRRGLTRMLAFVGWACWLIALVLVVLHLFRVDL
jgi:hypothetical protein